MKKLLFLLFTFATLQGFGQMSSMFFDQPKSRYIDIIDSIVAVLPDYKVDTIIQYKGEKGMRIEMLNTQKKVLAIDFSYFSNRIQGMYIIGKYEDIFTIHQRYFNTTDDKEAIFKKGYCADLVLKSLPDKKQLPISFCLDSNGTWYIRSNPLSMR